MTNLKVLAFFLLFPLFTQLAFAAENREFFGVCDGSFNKWVGGGYYELGWQLYTADVKEMARAGVQWLRLGFSPQSNLADLDRQLDILEAWGIKALGVLNVGNSLPEDLDAYQDWVREIVLKYPQITVWEIQNEPNLGKFWGGTVADYVTLLKAAYTAIKAVDPEDLVMLGGVSESNAEPYVVQLMELEAWQWCDLFGYHPYGADPARAEARLRSVQRLMAPTPFADKPIWITEIGFHTAQHWQGLPGKVPDEETKARYLVDIYQRLANNPGVEGPVFWYCFQEPGNTMGFGLLNRQLEVVEGKVEQRVVYSAAYEAYKALAEEWSGK